MKLITEADEQLDGLLDDDFEERADHVEENIIRDGTATGDHFSQVIKQLCAKGLVLLVGPRGCGKTHLMRYAWLSCLGSSKKPFSIYTSLNRYLSLEPWSRTRTDANSLFHSWVLGRILIATQETFRRVTGNLEYEIAQELQCSTEQLESLVNSLERNFELDVSCEDVHRKLSVETVKGIINNLILRSGRTRAILLLDDAALTLSPAFMAEFLDILRVIKSGNISPKCSIYPGTTLFGPRFHADHEGQTISAWVPVSDMNYRGMMQTIAQRRYPEGLTALSEDANALLQYAAFGIPRAYLTLLREFYLDKSRAGSQSSNVQSILTKVIRNHSANRIKEFRSIAEKVVELRTIIRIGEGFFKGVIEAVKGRNDELANKNLKQTTFGIDTADFDPMTNRMIDLLEEAGLLYKEEEVSHGKDRQYRRFSPHLAALIAERAFSGGARGMSPTKIVEFIERPSEKHPVRRTFKTIFAKQKINEILRLDLPPCQACNQPRENNKQKFCQHCGTKLFDDLIYNRIMAMEISLIPGLSSFLAEKVQSGNIRTVGDLRSIRDPGSELRKIFKIGESRSLRILSSVDLYIDEMMS